MIKKLSVCILLSSLFMGVMAQAPVTISGSLKTTKTANLKLFAVRDGKSVEISNSAPSETGKFGFNFYPEYEGLYLLGTGNGVAPINVNKFYFKSGDALNVEINDSTYVLVGKANTKENLILSKWHELSRTIAKDATINYSPSFVTFFPALEELNKKSKTFLVSNFSANKRFDSEIKSIIKMDMASYATNFLSTPRSVHPSVEELSPFYWTLKTQDFSQSTALIYNYPFGIRVLQGLIYLNNKQSGTKPKTVNEQFKNTFSLVQNDTLRGDMVLSDATYIKDFETYRSLMDEMNKYILTKNQKAKARELASSLATFKKGDPGFDFAYADNKGKMVKMSDLKGKVVVVDIWATWCGPCRAEFPSLKALEEEMKGKDVQVVSISVDELKDKEKWGKMIVDEKLGGLQLFAGGSNNDISKYYKVTGIPRFLVFDKKGKIVSVDAPRPSDPKLKQLLETELAKSI